MIEFVGLRDTIEEIEAELNEMPLSSTALLSSLSDIVLSTVEGFKTPVGDYDDNDTEIDSDLSEKKATINITGTKVMMIEYGAGIKAVSPAVYGFDGPAYGPGSYSKTEGTGEFANTGKWHHNKKEYDRQPSERYAYKAYDKVMNNIVDKAKEAFK